MAESIVTHFRNKGYKFANGTKEWSVLVTPKASRKGKIGDGKNCPLYLALDALPEVSQVYVQKKVTYVIFHKAPKTVVKFSNSADLIRKIGEMDSTGHFPVGEVTLRPPIPGERLDSRGVMARFQYRPLRSESGLKSYRVASRGTAKETVERMLRSTKVTTSTKSKKRLFGPRRIASFA